MAENLIAGGKSFIQKHPYAAGGIALGTVLVVWWIVASQSSASNTTAGSGSTDSTGTADAAAIQAAQIAANGNLAQAQLAAGVANNQTSAGLQAALAVVQGQTASAAYNSQSEIASSNSAVAIAQAQVQGDEQLSNNATLATEYTSLASVLSQYFSPGNAGAIGAAASPVSSGSAVLVGVGVPKVLGFNPTGPGGPVFSVSTGGAPLVNPQTAATNSAFLAGLGGLTAGLGVGLQTPQTTSLSPTQILSLAAINMGAANNSGGLPQS